MLDVTDTTMITLYAMVGSAANILVYCIGIVASVIFWRRSPRAALIGLGAMLWLLLLQIAMPISMALLGANLGVEAYAGWSVILGMLVNVLHALGIAALIVAVFVDRRGARRE
ncbi:hypothetical protein IQ266_25580 [filamentous cyanobacterium LEGE 11480]|uniref:Uncharacterized protein n=1 Tax=Romeriopsis navalis LEGE 11480 TaxID=2777977 RepID=A0A928VSV8_9CYAN|nr:hypothetical protein [Romeriopsis navalis]MBE9033113.1 hypothetical protein [Romeriopsis navalis LEGE 11480]